MKHLNEKTEETNLREYLDGPDHWQYRLKLANRISDAQLKMIDVRHWRVSQYVYGITDMGVVVDVVSKGATPEEAVLDHWRLLTQPNFFFRTNPTDHYKWNEEDLRWERYIREHQYGPLGRVL